jgi:hypothetical protein
MRVSELKEILDAFHPDEHVKVVAVCDHAGEVTRHRHSELPDVKRINNGEVCEIQLLFYS